MNKNYIVLFVSSYQIRPENVKYPKGGQASQGWPIEIIFSASIMNTKRKKMNEIKN